MELILTQQVVEAHLFLDLEEAIHPHSEAIHPLTSDANHFPSYCSYLLFTVFNNIVSSNLKGFWGFGEIGRAHV